ncbi:MAG TPA: hypothetical protein VLI90_16790 [Tepidisphaeraceae bacterium]|nr:hypothetical protein [Tepidisphaeraceae bacterium]
MLLIIPSIRAAGAAGDNAPLQTFTSDDVSAVIGAAQMSADGSRIVIDEYKVGDAGVPRLSAARVFDVATRKLLLEARPAAGDQAVEIKMSPAAGRFGLISRLHGDGSTSDELVEVETGRKLYASSARYGGGGGFFSPDRRQAFVCIQPPNGEDSFDAATFAVVALPSGKETGRLRLEHAGPSAVSPDGRYVVCNDLIYQLPGGQKVCQLAPTKGLQYFAAQAFTGDGQRYRVANREGTIFTWDVNSGRVISRIEPQVTMRLDGQAAFSKDAAQLLVAESGAIVFYDAETVREVGRWSHGPERRSRAILASLSDRAIAIAVEQRDVHQIAVVRLPDAHDLQIAPAPAPPRPAAPAATAPAAALPPHAPADLASADWWFDQAEREISALPANQQPPAIVSLLQARLQSGGDDEAAAARLLQKLASLAPPMERQRWEQELAKNRIRRLGSGDAGKAVALAEPFGPVSWQTQNVWTEVAAAQARAGEIGAAILTVNQLGKDAGGRAAAAIIDAELTAGKVAEARRFSDSIANDFWRQACLGKIATKLAKSGDVDGCLAIMRTLWAQSVVSDVQITTVQAAAGASNDAGANRIIDSLPEADREHARIFLLKSQLARGDMPSALVTRGTISETQQMIFHVESEFTQARVRQGLFDDAVAGIGTSNEPGEVAWATCKALIAAGKLDVADQMIAKFSTPRRWRASDADSLRASLKCNVAIAMANADRLPDARRLLTQADALDAKPAVGRSNEISLALAAAYRRAGDHSHFDELRKPYVNAVTAVTGAPSRAESLGNLLSFDLATGNIAAVQASLESADDALRLGRTLQVLVTLSGADDGSSRPPPLDQVRKLLSTLIDARAERAVPVALTAAAARHARDGKLADWLAWTATLSPIYRIAADQATGSAVLDVNAAPEHLVR